MNQSIALNQPLESIFWRVHANPLLRNILLILAGSLFLTVASKIDIPLQPVPVTLQTMAVFFIGMVYGWKLGVSTLCVYLGAAFLGLPILSGNYAGPAVFMGPTAGYIAGWVFATAISGFLVQRGWGKRWFTVMLAQLIGTIPLYILGLTVLSSFVGGWEKAIHLGLLPFIVTGTIKNICLSLVIPKFWRDKD